MDIQYVIGIFVGSIAIVGGGSALVMKFLNPNIKQDSKIALINSDVKGLKECQDKMEKSMDKLGVKVEEIMTNHLPHIEVALVRLETEVKSMSKNNSLQTKLIIDKLESFDKAGK